MKVISRVVVTIFPHPNSSFPGCPTRYFDGLIISKNDSPDSGSIWMSLSQRWWRRRRWRRRRRMLISGSFRRRRLKSGSGCGREAGRQRGSFRRSCPNTRVSLSSTSSSTSGFRGFVDVFDDARVTSSRRGVGVGGGRSRSRSSTWNLAMVTKSNVTVGNKKVPPLLGRIWPVPWTTMHTYTHNVASSSQSEPKFFVLKLKALS